MKEAREPLYTKPALLVAEVDDNGKEFDSLINESSFRISLKPSQALVDLFEGTNFTRRGPYTWMRHMGEGEAIGDISRFFTRYIRDFTPLTLYSSKGKMINGDAGAHLTRNNVSESTQPYFRSTSGNQHGVDARPIRDLRAVHGFHYQNHRTGNTYMDLLDNSLEDMRTAYYYNNAEDIDKIRHNEAFRNEISPGKLLIYTKNNRLWVKLHPNMTFEQDQNQYYMDTDHLTLDEEETYNALNVFIHANIALPSASGGNANYVPYAKASKIVDILNTYYQTSSSWDLEESSRALELFDKASNMITAGYAPGQPTKAYVTRGKNAQKLSGVKLAPGESKNLTITRILNAKGKNDTQEFAIHPSLFDVVNMNQAKDYTDDDSLHSYQKTAVGLHLSTKMGYLNSSDPGLGKSVMQLVAMRERANTIDNYRGLIGCEANVREQWEEYAKDWFEDAHVFVQHSSNQAEALTEALSVEGPVIIISSYALLGYVEDAENSRREEVEAFMRMTREQMKEYFEQKTEEEQSSADILYNTHWHDICADEAVCVRNGGSKQSRAMWTLRRNSDVAVALTGTPINKNVDEIGKLLEWVRNDNKLFAKKKLSVSYDVETLKGAKDLYDDLFPLVFRRERNEVKDEIEAKKTQKIPEMVAPESILLKPSSAEHSLAHAAEKELKRVYLELVSALDAVEATEENTEQIVQAKEQLKDAHGQWLGGTQLARMATSDPATLMDSDSVGASLLVGQGLVANALESEPTKRKEFIKRAQAHTANGERILVFTDFSAVATSLVESLRANGFSAGAFTGKNRKAREQYRKDFQNGDLDVLVCTKAAERGLTLHKASAVYHYDLPWTIERLIQRIGRAIRVGSENKSVKNYFMILEGTIEERVASQILSQGTTASMVLDASRGVDIEKTGLGNAMKGMMGASKSLASRKGALEFGKALGLDTKESAVA